MSRYLTPAKIGLLALIELYAEDVIPSDAILPVLSFISSHLTPRSSVAALIGNSAHLSDTERAVNLVISIKDFEKLLGSYPFLMGMPGRKLWDQFLGKLWGINSLDGLHGFMNDLTDMIMEGPTPEGKTSASRIRLGVTSPFGAFIRRCQYEMFRLPWDETTELWKSFVRYRQPTSQYLRRRIPGFSRLSFDNVLLTGEHEDWGPAGVDALVSVAYGDMLTGDRNKKLPVSTDDVEALLEFQLEQMHRYGDRVPLEIRHQFQDLLNDSATVPSLVHYLNYMDAWKAGDYTNAFDLLYRYFDNTMQYRDRQFYQYALMSLATLQADFGCYKDAVKTMLESVSTAREKRDMRCLNYALSWLFNFGRAHPDLVRRLESDSMLGTEKESLAYLRVKTKESSMWTLWSGALLSESILGLANGDSIATSVELMVRSSQIIVEKNMRDKYGPQMFMVSALWDRLGVLQLATTSCEVFLRCHSQNSTFQDELITTCRLALILAGRGRFDEALRKLEALSENSLRSLKVSKLWHKYRGIIKLKRDLWHNNLDGAEQLLDQLRQSKHDDLEPDLAFAIDLLHLDCLTRRGDLKTAFEKVDSMLAKMKDENKDIAYRTRLLLWKVYLLDQAGRPQRGFSIAMKAAGIAWRARLIPHLWQSIGAIANILVSLSEFEAATQLLTATIPRALECDAPELGGQLYSYLADANMGLAGTMPPKSAKRIEYMTAALAAVNKAFDNYSSIEDIQRQCEMMAKKAMIMKLSGDMVLAADYAAAYVSLRKTAEALSLGGSS